MILASVVLIVIYRTLSTWGDAGQSLLTHTHTHTHTLPSPHTPHLTGGGESLVQEDEEGMSPVTVDTTSANTVIRTLAEN